MRPFFTIMATFMVLIPNASVVNPNYVAEQRSNEDKYAFDIINKNGKIESGDSKCFCETGCYSDGRYNMIQCCDVSVVNRN